MLINDAILHYLAASGGKVQFTKFDAAVAVISEFQGKRCSSKALARQLDMLGHVETVWKNGISTLYLCQPSIALLPKQGKLEAVITGARIPPVLQEIEKDGEFNHTEIIRQSLSDNYPLVPDRILISSSRIEYIRKFAIRYKLLFCGAPSAPRIAQASVSISSFFPGEGEIDFPIGEAEYFNPSAKGFVQETTREIFWLARIRNPNNHLLSYMISQKPGTAAFVTDLDWARYWILHKLKYNVLVFDYEKKLLQVPIWAPLPRLLARALTLCEGIPPLYQNTGSNWSWLYTGILPDIAETVAIKLGQELKPENLEYKKNLAI